MRSLTLPERGILGRIIGHLQVAFTTNLASILDPDLRDMQLHIDTVMNSVELRLDSTVYIAPQAIIEVTQFAIRDIVLTANLLVYLEENGYIVFYSSTPAPPALTIGNFVMGNPYTSTRIYDQQTIDRLKRYAVADIMILQPLIDYFQRGFRTQDEVNREVEDVNRAEDLRLAKISL